MTPLDQSLGKLFGENVIPSPEVRSRMLQLAGEVAMAREQVAADAVELARLRGVEAELRHKLLAAEVSNFTLERQVLTLFCPAAPGGADASIAEVSPVSAGAAPVVLEQSAADQAAAAMSAESAQKFADAERSVARKAVAAGLEPLSVLATLKGANEPQIGDQFGGGIYAGLTEVDGKPARLILLPGEAKEVSWDSAMTWAKLQGRDLPTRAEQRSLYENLKSEFSPNWYWSSTQHERGPAVAWSQSFDDGGQNVGRKSYAGSARAVRRLPI